MKVLPYRALLLGIPGLLFCLAQVQAQMPDNTISTGRGPAMYDALAAGYAGNGAAVGPVDPAESALDRCQQCGGTDCRRGCGVGCFQGLDPGFYAGAEYLLIRPHFSEAVAFARGTQTLPTSFEVEGRELQFDYDDSFRIFAGYRGGYGGGELRFTYWHFFGDISVEGTTEGSEFIVDPFGNVVGTLRVMDLGDVRGLGTLLASGDEISTRATVRTNVYDLDFITPVMLGGPNWGLNWSVGVRIADIDQYYESVITLAGAPFSRGDFSADFIGAGPRFGVEARRYFGAEGRLSLFANGHAALLVGEDTIRSSNAPNPFFLGSQSESLTRTIPVMETELGLSWSIGNSLSLSVGWLFQAWFDLGTSGGQFGGFFGGADDSNIMSFDGMFLRGQWTF
jgi:hypothetical protein